MIFALIVIVILAQKKMDEFRLKWRSKAPQLLHPLPPSPTKNLITNIYCNENVLQIFSNLKQVLHLKHIFFLLLLLCTYMQTENLKRIQILPSGQEQKWKEHKHFTLKKISTIAKGICNADYSILG